MRVKQIKEQLRKIYPQNFLIKKPITGALLFLIFVFAFVVIYRPIVAHEARSLSFDFTMLAYSFIMSIWLFILLMVLKKLPFFSKNEEWTFMKEIIFDAIVLFTIGIAAYFAGFIIEEPASRWNFPTFIDSLQKALLLGIIPVFFFTILNIRYLFTPEIYHNFTAHGEHATEKPSEQIIQIASKAKKEELSFYPHQFVYAESNGNYVVFHLVKNDGPTEVMIRNSMSDIEKQLAVIPHFMRIHRAFIVNLKNVISKKGNALGYRLKMEGSKSVIPVSRQNIQKFDQMMK
ncbi:MAG: LytTR family transcriptional regulator DNA-binding domain-containing protein [Prolixibacteraceae bacterium]|nr:LytTR family transcriptional regulator DNA-binding domain-containing protein [Prolixibacteraceae bacterium]